MGKDGKDLVAFVEMVDQVCPFHRTDMGVGKKPWQLEQWGWVLVGFLDFPILHPKLDQLVEIRRWVQLVGEHDGHQVVFQVKVVERVEGVFLWLFFPGKDLIEVDAGVGQDTGEFMEDHETGVVNLQGQGQPRDGLVAMEDMWHTDVFQQTEGVMVFEFFLVVHQHIGIFLLHLEEILDLCDALKPFVLRVLGVPNVIDQMDEGGYVSGWYFVVLDDDEHGGNQDGKDVLVAMDVER